MSHSILAIAWHLLANDCDYEKGRLGWTAGPVQLRVGCRPGVLRRRIGSRSPSRPEVCGADRPRLGVASATRFSASTDICRPTTPTATTLGQLPRPPRQYHPSPRLTRPTTPWASTAKSPSRRSRNKRRRVRTFGVDYLHRGSGSRRPTGVCIGRTVVGRRSSRTSSPRTRMGGGDYTAE